MKKKGLIIFLIYFVLQVIRIFCSYKSLLLGTVIAYLVGFFTPLLIIEYYESNYKRVFAFSVIWETFFLILAIVIDGDISFGTPIWVAYYLGTLLAFIFYTSRNKVGKIIFSSIFVIIGITYIAYGNDKWMEYFYNKEIVKSTRLETINFIAPGKEIVQNDGVTILYFWSEFCPPCFKYLPKFRELGEREANQEHHFHTVYLHSGSKKELSFEGLSPKVGELFIEQNEAGRIGIVGVPHILIFDNGILEKSFIGYDTFEKYYLKRGKE